LLLGRAQQVANQFPMGLENVLVWNVRGLHVGAHWHALRDLVAAERISLVCIQETKLDVISNYDVIQLLGSGFEYVYLPAIHTQGGFLVAWCASVWVASRSSTQLFSVSVWLHHTDDGPKWWLTSVYGPSLDANKDALDELHDLWQVRSGPWMINGDFNLIYHAEDKNNDRLNRRRMGQFCQFINDASIQQIHLNGRLFTWSNERAHLTLECIDRVFISNEWDAIFPDYVLHSLPSQCTDHASLLLCTEDDIRVRKCFHFRSFWPRLPSFLNVVTRAWHCLLGNACTFARLHWLLHNMAKCLKSWSDRMIGSIRL
jgi:hypothetical protein